MGDLTYKGHSYQPRQEREGDVKKIYHDVVTPTGETVHLDVSPYSFATKEIFELWVELGCPRRGERGLPDRYNFTMADLLKLKEHK